MPVNVRHDPGPVRGSRALRLLLCAALAGSAIGCKALISPTGPSNVAQGRYYATGDVNFDAFFFHLYELQLSMVGAPKELAETRNELAMSVGAESGENATDEELATKLKSQLEALAGRGVRAPLSFAPLSACDVELGKSALQAGANAEGEDHSRLERISASITRLIRVHGSMQDGERKLDELDDLASKLEGQSSKHFDEEGAYKRDEVKVNLADGRKVIDLMRQRAEEVRLAAKRLLEALEQSAGSSSAPAPPPAPADAGPPPARAPGPPRAPSAAPAAPPKAPPPGGKPADFEP